MSDTYINFLPHGILTLHLGPFGSNQLKVKMSGYFLGGKLSFEFQLPRAIWRVRAPLFRLKLCLPAQKPVKLCFTSQNEFGGWKFVCELSCCLRSAFWGVSVFFPRWCHFYVEISRFFNKKKGPWIWSTYSHNVNFFLKFFQRKRILVNFYFYFFFFFR